MYLNVYVPLLQTPAGVAHYLRDVCGYQVPSSALLAPRTRDFVAAIKRFVKRARIDLIQFQRGERKDDRAQDYLRRFSGDQGVLFVGVAQEKAYVPRTVRRRRPNSDSYYPWLMSSTAYVNYYYVYAVDEDFGPFFIKFCSYFPFNAKLCINGHEYLKRQLTRAGIAFEALDNGILTCADPERMQQLSSGLTAARIDALLRKWLGRLPHPFSSADRVAGLLYQVSILQAEFSLTQVLDRPLHGRAFFEDVIRENLDLGRPDQVQLIFDRRINKRTPSRFRTRVITQGVVPSLHVDYKHSRIKQYHKEERALRTETVINDCYDFAVGRRLDNLDQLKELGSPPIDACCASNVSATTARSEARCSMTCSGRKWRRQWSAWCRAALRLCSGASAAVRVAGLPAAAAGIRQSPVARPHGTAARRLGRALVAGPHDLRPAPVAGARADRTHPSFAALPGHRARHPRRAVLPAYLRARAASYAGGGVRSQPTAQHRLQRTVETFDREIDRLWEGHELAA